MEDAQLSTSTHTEHSASRAIRQVKKERCANGKGEENEPQAGRMVSIYCPKSPQEEQAKTLDLFNFTEWLFYLQVLYNKSLIEAMLTSDAPAYKYCWNQLI